jgi:hypothetical protein
MIFYFVCNNPPSPHLCIFLVFSLGDRLQIFILCIFKSKSSSIFEILCANIFAAVALCVGKSKHSRISLPLTNTQGTKSIREMNSSSSSSLSPPSHSTRMTMILCVVGVIMMLYNTFIIMSHHHSSSSPPTSQKHLNKHEAEGDDEYDRPAIDGQWLWDEWQRLSAHDKKAIFALVASVTQYDFQVCVGKFFSFSCVCVLTLS